MSPREWRFRIEDIAEALAAIEEYTAGLDFVSWSRDRKTIDAVIRNFEIIGEAASNVPEEIQYRYRDLPWAQLKGIRNVLIHEYFGVDTAILWKTIQEDLPILRNKIQSILSAL